MAEIRLPRLNSNDLGYVLVEWLTEPGAAVRQGDPVAVVESSKAVEEITAPRDGWMHHLVPVGREYAVGELIGRVAATAEEVPARAVAESVGGPGPGAEPDADLADGMILTGPAREAAARLGIDPQRLGALGKKVVRRTDVEALAGPGITLDRQQLAVAATVTRSHATIPAGFSVVRIPVDDAIEAGRAATRRLRAMVGLPEIVLAAIAAAGTSFPEVFAEPVDERSLRPATHRNVAVTIDVGSGLYTPVVHEADTLSLGEIAAALQRFRHTAMRGRFRPDELAGGNILLSLSGDDGVVFTQPIVHPGHLAALSLGGVVRELEPVGGTPDARPRRVVHLGMAYDHRYLNGAGAVRFLLAVRAEVGRLAAQNPSAGEAVR